MGTVTGKPIAMETLGALLAVSMLIASSAAAPEDPTPELKRSRNPKVYLISTTTSTSTLSTTSVCFTLVQTTDVLQACGKKKRSISFLEDKPTNQQTSEIIAPNPALKAGDDDAFAKLHDIADVTGGKNDEEDYEEREAKFFNYWMTTTITTTFTTYTATSSLGSIICTPVGFTDSNCPLHGK